MRFSTILLLSLMLFGLCTGVQAQDVVQSRQYRVIAYKNGDVSVESVSNVVEVFPSIALYVPSAFTPNGDGINDVFGAYGEALLNFNMQIWNRWGQLLFESTDATARWDGSYKGEKVPEGTYVYIINARGADGTPNSKSGEVLLLN
ncbi:MAG: gliding motility-associated C-terminal domain-containing protein [Bacteroidia bacterium]|nr:gliding motility-associated C-terminal domain-containing protein [Bacteroidia bacterium]